MKFEVRRKEKRWDLVKEKSVGKAFEARESVWTEAQEEGSSGHSIYGEW